MLHLVRKPLSPVDPALREIALRVDRHRLAKRLWRGTADDGVEFGFELDQPLKPGDTVHQTATTRTVIVQEAEAVLELSLAGLPASAVAGIAWSAGNLHLELSGDADRLLTPDEPAARQLFARIQIPATPTTAIFRPGRFVRGAAAANAERTPAHELGSSHRH